MKNSIRITGDYRDTVFLLKTSKNCRKNVFLILASCLLLPAGRERVLREKQYEIFRYTRYEER